MANWWDNDPVEQATPLRFTVTPQAPPPAAEPDVAGEWWANDPVEGADGALSVRNVATSIARGVPVLGGLVDEAVAGGQALFGDGSYEDNLKAEQARHAAFDEQNPITSTATQIAGGVLGTVPLVAAAPVMMGARGASLIGRAVAGGLSGGALGGVDAAVRSDGDAWEGTKGAMAGLGLGAAGPVVGRVLGGAISKGADALGMRANAKAAIASAPTVEALEDQANALYKRAEQAGVSLKPGAYQFFLGGLARELKQKGFDRSLHPRAKAAVERLVDGADMPKSLQELEILRRVVGAAANSTDPDERRVASLIKENMDDWLENLPNGAVASGNARDGIQSLKEARALWGQARRGELIQEIMDAAQLAASGYENGLRIGFRNLAKSEKKMRGFSEVEKRAIRAVAQGTSTSNVMKWLGKAAPTGIVSMALGNALGQGMGGTIGSIAVPAIGAAGRAASEALTSRGAETASALARQPRIQQQMQPALGRVNRETIERAVQSGAIGLVPTVKP